MSLVKNLRSVIRFEPVRTDPVERRLPRAACVDDLRRLARLRLPRGVFDYVDGGAEDEITLAANRSAFSGTGFRPRVLRGVGTADPSTRLMGDRSRSRSCSRRPVSPASCIPTVNWTMTLLGAASVPELDRSLLDRDVAGRGGERP